MILTCPSCGTQYVVKDGAIPPTGRQVRCASCKHSWHQNPEGGSDFPVGDAPPQPQAPAPENATLPVQERESAALDIDSQDQRPTSASIEPADVGVEEESKDWPEPVPFEAETSAHDEAGQEEGHWFPPPEEEEDDFGPFGDRDRPAPERGRSPLLTILLLVIAVALLAAAFWFLAPATLKSQLGIAQADTSPLQLILTHSQRQELASGNILLAVTGRVINPTDENQSVPPIQAELRKKSGEIVYSWTISPPARSIPPGGRAPFNSAEMNVPAEGDLLTITFGAPKA